MTNVFGSCKCVLFSVTFNISCIVMHVGRSVATLRAFMLNCRTGIYVPLFSTWFSLDIQSAMYRSGPG